VRDQVSHPYKTTGKISVLYTLNLTDTFILYRPCVLSSAY
jgi:hypothetical protein